MIDKERDFTFRQNSPEKKSSEKLSGWARKFLTTVAIATLAYTPLVGIASAQFPEPTSIRPEVYNGREAEPEEKAFSAAVLSAVGVRCSGIIKSPSVVLTADHCVGEVPPNYIFVIPAGDPNHKVIDVKKIVKIGQDIFYDNDQVALLLAEPITFSETINSIPIGHASMLGKFPLFVIGHGQNENNLFTLDPIVGQQTLNPSYSCNLTNMISTRNVNDSPDEPVIFFGDSGGGLFTHLDTPYYVEEEDKMYVPGNYLLAISTRFCSEIIYRTDGEPDPHFAAGFHTVFDPKIKAEIEKIVELAPSLTDENLYLPQVNKASNLKLLLPVVRSN